MGQHSTKSQPKKKETSTIIPVPLTQGKFRTLHPPREHPVQKENKHRNAPIHIKRKALRSIHIEETGDPNFDDFVRFLNQKCAEHVKETELYEILNIQTPIDNKTNVDNKVTRSSPPEPMLSPVIKDLRRDEHEDMNPEDWILLMPACNEDHENDKKTSGMNESLQFLFEQDDVDFVEPSSLKGNSLNESVFVHEEHFEQQFGYYMSLPCIIPVEDSFGVEL